MESEWLAFVAVLIKRSTLQAVGILDERYVGYGWDDVDYSMRTTKAGLDLWVYPGCVVEHGSVPSTYRTSSDIYEMGVRSKQEFNRKWGRR